MRIATQIIHQPSHTFHPEFTEEAASRVPTGGIFKANVEATKKHMFAVSSALSERVAVAKEALSNNAPVFVVDEIPPDSTSWAGEDDQGSLSVHFPLPYTFQFFDKKIHHPSGSEKYVGIYVWVHTNPATVETYGPCSFLGRTQPTPDEYKRSANAIVSVYSKSRPAFSSAGIVEDSVGAVEIVVFRSIHGKATSAGIGMGILGSDMHLRCIMGSDSIAYCGQRNNPAALDDSPDGIAFESQTDWLLEKLRIVTGPLNLLSCKNISIGDAEARFNQDEKWRRRQKQPSIKYKVLKVSAPGSRQPPVDLAGRGEGGWMPHHMCRGHYATYTEEKPLFGKYSGRFWIPAHVKGSLKNGAVIKDYEVRL